MPVKDCYIYRELALGMSWYDPEYFFHLELERIQAIYDPDHTKVLIMSICWEYECKPSWFDLLDRFLRALRTRFPRCKILLLANSWYTFVFGNRWFDADDVFYVDFFLFRVYVDVFLRRKSPMMSHWNPLNSQILILTGKAHRINRARLLYKLMKSDAAGDLNWSLKVTDQHATACRAYLADISDQEFSWFLTQQRSCDQYFPSNAGIPYEAKNYETALFQVVSETNFDRPVYHPSMTEKTWLPIFNCRPFILAAERGVLDDLESRGFDVFRKFLPIPNYDNPDRPDFLQYGPVSAKQGHVVTKNQERHWHDFYSAFRDQSWPQHVTLQEISSLPKHIRDEINSNYTAGIESLDELRLDAIVENAVFWKHNLKKIANEITKITQHNQNRAIELGKELYVAFNDFMTKHSINFDLDYLLWLYDLPPEQSDVYDVDPILKGTAS